MLPNKRVCQDAKTSGPADCIACCAKPAVRACVPCGHVLFCEAVAVSGGAGASSAGPVTPPKRDCATEWFQKKKECPTCRAAVDTTLRVYS